VDFGLFARQSCCPHTPVSGAAAVTEDRLDPRRRPTRQTSTDPASEPRARHIRVPVDGHSRQDGHVSLTTVTTHNVAEAKAHLSQLLDAALKGEDVILARAGKPLVRLVPIDTPAPRVLGFLDLPSPDERFDPLNETELTAWS
jgi:prevent-host-death family protein